MITFTDFFKTKNRKELIDLYNTTFPHDETVNILYLLYLRIRGKADFYAVEEDGKLIGLVYNVRDDSLVYLFYLIVKKEYRQKGYGSKILNLIKEYYGDKPITLTIESPYKEDAENIDERKKRLKFYEKNGYSLINVPINDWGVEYEMLSTNGIVTKEEFLRLMRNTYFYLYFYRVYHKNGNMIKYLFRKK